MKSKSKTFTKKETQTLEVKIEKIVPGGYGLGFAEGLTIFVALAAVGDRLRVRVREKKGKVVFAEIVEIIKPSPERQTPPCPYFGRCGGCDFQQLNYAAQLAAKVSIIRDSLERIGKIQYEGEIPIIASPDELHYRLRAQWHVDSRKKKIGYFKRFSHEIIDVATCPILAPPLQKTLTEFRENLSFGEIWSEQIEIETATNGADVSVYSTEIIEPTREIFFSANDEKYRFDANSFFQGNIFLIQDLVRLAVAGAKGGTSLDLFCGIGLFTLPLARKFKKVIGVEANEKAIDFARQNADNARLQNIEFHVEQVGEFLQENQLPKIDFVLLDPPRAGAERETIDALLRLEPEQISYVSCDPATLARDLHHLIEKFEIESITAVDLFPQTHHVETIVRLKWKGGFANSSQIG